MELKDKIWIASKYAEKGYDYETLRYGDDLYGQENISELTDEIWEYIDEYREFGRRAFYEKYKEYKLY